MYHLHKSVPLTEKRLRKPETCIKDCFDVRLKRPEKSCSINFLTEFSGNFFVNGKQPEFLFGKFRPEKQGYLFRRSGAPGNFPLRRKVVFYLFCTRIFRKHFVHGETENPYIHLQLVAMFQPVEYV